MQRIIRERKSSAAPSTKLSTLGATAGEVSRAAAHEHAVDFVAPTARVHVDLDHAEGAGEGRTRRYASASGAGGPTSPAMLRDDPVPRPATIRDISDAEFVTATKGRSWPLRLCSRCCVTRSGRGARLLFVRAERALDERSGVCTSIPCVLRIANRHANDVDAADGLLAAAPARLRNSEWHDLSRRSRMERRRCDGHTSGVDARRVRDRGTRLVSAGADSVLKISGLPGHCRSAFADPHQGHPAPNRPILDLSQDASSSSVASTPDQEIRFSLLSGPGAGALGRGARLERSERQAGARPADTRRSGDRSLLCPPLRCGVRMRRPCSGRRDVRRRDVADFDPGLGVSRLAPVLLPRVARSAAESRIERLAFSPNGTRFAAAVYPA